MKENLRLFKFLVSILLMYLLLLRMDAHAYKSIFCHASADGVAAVIAAYVVSVLFNAVKWHILLPHTNLGVLVDLSFRAQLYSVVLPGQMFGEASKLASWPGQEEGRSHVAASIIFDRITGLIGQVLIGAMGLFASQRVTDITGKWAVLSIAAAGVIGVLASASGRISPFIYRGSAFLGKYHAGMEKRCASFYDAWRFFSADKGVLSKSIAWGIVNQWVGILSLWYLSDRMGLNVGGIEYCWMIPLLSVILLLPISFAGLGLRDASMASMLSLFAVPVSNALVLSTAMLVAQLVAAGIGGIYVIKANFQSKG